MMRVAYIIPYLQRASGWRTHTMALLRAMREHIEPVLFVAEEDYLQARSLFPEFQIYSLPATQQASMQSGAGLSRLAASYARLARINPGEINLVHSLEAYPTGLIGSWLAGRLGCPHVITTHGTYGVIWHTYRLDRLMYRQVLRKTGLICPVSHGTAEMMQRYFGEAIAQAVVRPILNGNEFYKSVPVEEARLRPMQKQGVVLTVGDVKPRKGQHISLAAFARVKAKFPQAQYRLAGYFDLDNAYFRRLKQFITDQQLDGVTFLGAVSDGELRRQYQQASLFVLTPQQEGMTFEGFGLVYLEAGAYGLPVVGTRSGGVADAIREGETGFLLDEGDVDGLAAAMISLLVDPILNRKLGVANREWAETLTWERSAQEQFAAYQDLLARQSRRRA